MNNERLSLDLNDANEYRLRELRRTQSQLSYFAREELTVKDIEERYSMKLPKSDNIWKSTKNYVGKNYKPTRGCMKDYFLDRVPFFKWIRKYEIKENLPKDIIAGLTIGVLQIPQGMAYSLMAGLPPVIGLYVSFWAVIVYSFLGTSRHLSTGTYAITSLMINSCIEKLEGKYYSNINTQRNETVEINNSTSNSNFLSDDPTKAKIMIATALAFYTGVIQVLFALLHVGFVTRYLSDIIVSAFTIGASYHIVVTQITTLLGLKKNVLTTPFTLIEEIVEIIGHVSKTNHVTLIISIVSMAFIFSVKQFINERYKAKMFAPIPVDIIVVIFATLFSYLFSFKDKWSVKIVGEIPLGFPEPFVPPLHIFSDIIDNAINISIVSFAINISMAKLFAKKYKYSIQPNQELFSYGIGNLFCSFFSGFPSCVGLSRSVILDSIGAKTQIFGILSSLVVMIVILWLGQLFETLPNACLASIIVVALLKMMFEVRVIRSIFKKSKFEALAWLITFGSVVVLDIDYGLYIGIAFSLLLIIVQSQRPAASVLGNIPFTDIYESIDICEEAKEYEKIKIIRYESSLYYANVDNFTYKVTKLSGVNPSEVIQKTNKLKTCYEKRIKSAKANMNEIEIEHLKVELENKIGEIQSNLPITDIILDFSCTNYIDSTAIQALSQLNDTYKEIGIRIHLTYCKRFIFRAFKKNLFKDKFDYSNIYPTIHDAIMSILRKKNSLTFDFFFSKPVGSNSVSFLLDEKTKNISESASVNQEENQEEYENYDEIKF